MSRSTIVVDDRLADYLDATNRPENDAQRHLRDVTGKMSNAGMQIGPNQGSFMAFLIKLTGARNALEIGTFTGYSALTVAGSDSAWVSAPRYSGPSMPWRARYSQIACVVARM